MACTKQTYTAVATWTASELASLFRSAFIDAGLMTDWHDSFLSGSIENRILAVSYDNTKTYGVSYYWFKFDTSGVLLSMATNWNTTSKVPTGTQFLDFVESTTNSASGSWRIRPSTTNLSTGNTVNLIRYTSGIDSDQSWFTIESGAFRLTFSIVKPQMTLQPWMDLGKGSFCGFAWLRLLCGGDPLSSGSAARYATLSFLRGPALRRDLVVGSALYNSTNSGAGAYSNEEGGAAPAIPLIAYAAVGYESNNYFINVNGLQTRSTASIISAGARPGAIILPNNFTSNNPAFPSNSNPVYHSMPFMPYINENLPSDFGITFQYATNNFSVGDRLIVSAGLEEWEVVNYAGNASAVTGASPLFVARMV